MSEYDNVRKESYLLCLKKKLGWQEQPDRAVVLNKPDAAIGDNSIQTNKYTWIDVLPLNLYEQFSRLANVYFLVIGLLSMIKAISSTNGRPVVFFPLGVILTVNILKNIFEDLKRRKSDKRENSSKVRRPHPDPGPPAPRLRSHHLGQPARRPGGPGRKRPADPCRPGAALLGRREGQLLRGDQKPRRRDQPQGEARQPQAARAVRRARAAGAGRAGAAVPVRASEPVPVQLQRLGRAAGRGDAAAGQRRVRAARLRAAEHGVHLRAGDVQRARGEGDAELGEGAGEDVAAGADDEPTDHLRGGAADEHVLPLRGALGDLPAALPAHAEVHGVRQRPLHRQRRGLVRRLAHLPGQVAPHPQRLHPHLTHGLARDGQVLPGRRRRQRPRHEVHLLRRHRRRSPELLAHRRARPDRLHLQRQDRHPHLQRHGLQEALLFRRSLRRGVRHQGRPRVQNPAQRLRPRPQALPGPRRPRAPAARPACPHARVPGPLPHGAGRRRGRRDEVLRRRG